MRGLLSSFLIVTLFACNSGSSASRASDQLAALKKKQEAEAKAKKDKDNKLEPLPVEVVKLDPATRKRMIRPFTAIAEPPRCYIVAEASAVCGSEGSSTL